MKACIAFIILAFVASDVLAALPFDIVYLLDESGSPDAIKFSQEKNYILNSANSLMFGCSDVAVNVILFANSSRIAST